ncbi:hypothetical protein QYE76_061456 [Lolium multiflorum]|uniref:Uncharacterized protein n=1 Tax=Lolium multiflorum TaxID=4521 RepID=A0AAD8W4Q8_LOLMU|nr:hypothetical protein QYE76_061456 [Lolium multiflorum]
MVTIGAPHQSGMLGDGSRCYLSPQVSHYVALNYHHLVQPPLSLAELPHPLEALPQGLQLVSEPQLDGAVSWGRANFKHNNLSSFVRQLNSNTVGRDGRGRRRRR